MRGTSLVVVGFLAPLTGCHIYHNAARNIWNEPIQYFDTRHLENQLRKDAKHAWAEVGRQYPARHFCEDFVEGFYDGYADYLNNGGTAQLPAVPPVKYRRSKFLNPEGHERIRQYFLGFKYGMDVAIDTGCRTFLTVPVVLPEPPPPVDPNIRVVQPPVDVPVPALPAPKPVAPAVPKGDEPKPPVPAAPPAKSADKDKSPPASVSAEIPIPIPTPKPVGEWKPSTPPGTVTIPPGVIPSTPDAPKPRPLFPIGSNPGAEPTPPVQQTSGQQPARVPASRPGPVFDLPAVRPVFDLPDYDR